VEDARLFSPDPPIHRGAAMYGDPRSKDLPLEYITPERKAEVLEQVRCDLVLVLSARTTSGGQGDMKSLFRA